MAIAYICYFVFPFEIRLFNLEVSKKVWYFNGNGNIEYGLNCVFAGKKETIQRKTETTVKHQISWLAKKNSPFENAGKSYFNNTSWLGKVTGKTGSGWQLQMSDLLLAGFEERIRFSHGS